jgi:hypothetical protein
MWWGERCGDAVVCTYCVERVANGARRGALVGHVMLPDWGVWLAGEVVDERGCGDGARVLV